MTTAIGSYATPAALKTRMGITDTTDDTLLGLICDQINSYIEGPMGTGRVLAPIASATYLLDGDGSPTLHYPKGIQSVSLLQIKWFTQDTTLHTIPTTDYRLRPRPDQLPNGWPATRIEIVDIPLGGVGYFPPGYDTVSVTMTTGFAATPDEITELALVAAGRAWHAVQTGQSDIVGTDAMGRPLVSRYFSARDRDLLYSYSVNLPG